MEKHGAIDPKVTPPEADELKEKKAAAQQFLLKELEDDVNKRLAEHASGCCGGSCKNNN